MIRIPVKSMLIIKRIKNKLKNFENGEKKRKSEFEMLLWSLKYTYNSKLLINYGMKIIFFRNYEMPICNFDFRALLEWFHMVVIFFWFCNKSRMDLILLVGCNRNGMCVIEFSIGRRMNLKMTLLASCIYSLSESCFFIRHQA